MNTYEYQFSNGVKPYETQWWIIDLLIGMRSKVLKHSQGSIFECQGISVIPVSLQLTGTPLSIWCDKYLSATKPVWQNKHPHCWPFWGLVASMNINKPRHPSVSAVRAHVEALVWDSPSILKELQHLQLQLRVKTVKSCHSLPGSSSHLVSGL